MANIPIIADVPAHNPGLGFPEYAAALTSAIKGGEPARFTIGLYGPWGSGKSSLLSALRNILEEDKGVIPVMFDAWRYEKSPQLIVPLLHKIFRALKDHKDKSLSETVSKALKSIMFSFKFNVGGLEVGVDKEKLQKALGDDLMPLDEAFSKPYEELQKLSKSLKDERIVVLIDDLDRCSPDAVVSILESIKLVMDLPGFIFVLALDYDVLIHAVKEKYPHVSADVYLHKIIQIPFRVPPLDLEGQNFVRELIPNWDRLQDQLSDDFVEEIRTIATMSLNSNPRQIKRLVNSFLLLDSVVKQREVNYDQIRLLSILAFQLRWPSNFYDFQDAVFAGDDDPLKKLREDEEEPELQRFISHYYKGSIPISELKNLLQLTEVVSSQEQKSESATANSLTDAREINREGFPAELGEKGFEKSPRSDKLYYNSSLPKLRVSIGKHVIRLEQKDKKGRWDLSSSFLLSKETEKALKALDQMVKAYK
ncbi:MAG: P-loop NTPase fold protein [Cytophagales bacterium]|nr:P-loop NTPase fold protein [Cytophagales bacterium]